MRRTVGEQTKRCLKACLLVFMVIFISLFYCVFELQSNAFQDYVIEVGPSKNYNDSDISEKAVKDGYIVWSPSCRIPNISAHHESISHCVGKWKPVICSPKKPLTEIRYNSSTKLHSIHVRRDESYGKVKQCCYYIATRKYQKKTTKNNDDNRFTLSNPVCFSTKAILPRKTEFIYVKCSDDNKHDVFKTVHSMVIEKPRKHADLSPKFSVLLVCIDSISRLNFIRTMPQTHRYMEANNWLPLEGYTKVGDNTFPNIVPILTGMSSQQLENSCYHPKKKIDDCPFIWKNYQQHSYLTAYLEDAPSISSFNYNKYGFLNSPTDYYIRPMLVAARKMLKIKEDGGMEYCLGSQPHAEYVFQYGEELVKRFHNTSYFNLMWLNTFSHNELNMPSVMDRRTKQFFETIEPYLNSTIVVFFSDHGMRFGKIRETFVGWLEERMPFIYFHLPPSFQNTYPEKLEMLKANKNRLTSPYDLHATLHDILDRSVRPKGCEKCGSLFKKVSWNRTCTDASIGEHWCTCSSEFESVSNKEPVVLAAVNYAINDINSMIRKKVNDTSRGTKCALLSLKKILSVRSKVHRLRIFSQPEYVIVFETKPSGAIFETTVVEQGKTFDIPDSISRINAYGSQSYCSSDAVLKKYCFCIKN